MQGRERQDFVKRRRLTVPRSQQKAQIETTWSGE